MPIHAPKNLVFGAKIGEGIFGFRPQPNQTPKVLTKFREDQLKNATVSVPTDTHTHTYIHTHTYTDKKTDLIICPMLWYSNGTDKKP